MPFAFVGKCQRANLTKQIELGIRLFDLRVRFDRNGNPVICHGLLQYAPDRSVESLLDEIDKVNGCCVRVVLETTKPNGYQEDRFRVFCQTITHKYKHTHYFGGNNRTDWNCRKPIYDFGCKLEDIEHKYSSTTTLFPNKNWKWLQYVDDIFPYLYAKLNNKRNVKKGTLHKWLMFDFVDIK